MVRKIRHVGAVGGMQGCCRVDANETSHAMNATDKQVKYIMYLLSVRGYSTQFMDATFKHLGAGMRDRSGRVIDWVSSLGIGEAAKLIEKLKS